MTGLVGGARVSKGHARLETYGTIDELNSILGVARSSLRAISKFSSLEAQIRDTQNTLFNLGSRLACEDQEMLTHLPDIRNQDIQMLETAIDKMTEELPELRQFILPGGSEESSLLHWARTVCRRAEREVIRFSETQAVQENHIQYLNRLSDFLFVAARFANHIKSEPEITWTKPE